MRETSGKRDGEHKRGLEWSVEELRKPKKMNGHINVIEHSSVDSDKVMTATLQQLAILGWGSGSTSTWYSEAKYRAIHGFSKLFSYSN